MSKVDQANVRNQLLAALPPGDFAALTPALQPVRCAFKQILSEPEQPIAAAYFPESGMVLMLAPLANGEFVEVGIVGREGMVGLSLILGEDRSTMEAMVQMKGTAWRVRAAKLRWAFNTSPGVRELLLRYVQAFQAQAAQITACHGRHALEARLARWLLMAHDRAEAPTFPITHDLIALMQGTNRPQVSVVAAKLQRMGAVTYTRGHITVLDRPVLEAIACDCYGTMRRQFERLLGVAAGE